MHTLLCIRCAMAGRMKGYSSDSPGAGVDGGSEDLSMHGNSNAAMPSVSPYGSAERSFRNHSEASEEAALTRQVLTLAEEQRMLSSHAIRTSDARMQTCPCKPAIKSQAQS